MGHDAPLLTMSGVRKSFGPVTALDGVDLRLERGEVLGLLGGNGAGKTTLMNVLYGLYQADEGEIRIQGRRAQIRSPKDAMYHRIGMVHQHFLQVATFTVAENIVLGTTLANRPVMKLQTAKNRIRMLSLQFGLEADADAPLEGLPMGVRQRVEILKALYRGVDVLILDEPTTLLTPQEVDTLFASLREMVASGMSVIFITHKLREVLAVCDRITVLRGGKSVLTVPRAEASERVLVEAMVGEALAVEQSLLFSGEDPLGNGELPAAAKEVVRAEGLTVSENGQTLLRQCTFTLRQGEILGVAGVAGNGQRQLAESLLGLRPLTGGLVQVLGRDVKRTAADQLLAAGVAYVPEDRWGDGFLPTATVAQNLILGRHRQPPYSDGRFLDLGVIRQRADALIREFSVVTEGPQAEAANLSGGNIQRVLLARAFSAAPKLLIVHNPTQGLDIPSIEFIYGKLLAGQAGGMATLLISENLDELFLLCHRIAVLYNGAIMAIVDRDRFDAYAIGRLMSGAPAHG
jgi:simple sugar transport system ATP-binding protein